jgi:hypothetical protein
MTMYAPSRTYSESHLPENHSDSKPEVNDVTYITLCLRFQLVMASTDPHFLNQIDYGASNMVEQTCQTGTMNGKKVGRRWGGGGIKWNAYARTH